MLLAEHLCIGQPKMARQTPYDSSPKTHGELMFTRVIIADLQRCIVHAGLTILKARLHSSRQAATQMRKINMTEPLTSF